MKKLITGCLALLLALVATAQVPQRMSYQAVVRDGAGKLLQNAPVGIRLSILRYSPTAGEVVYSETHTATTNVNGLVVIRIGIGTPTGNFSAIDWGNGPYFLKTETDPAGGTAYSITGVDELITVPYAFNAETVGQNNFSGSYDELTNKPVTDGSETKITAGNNIRVTGTGTQADPYQISRSDSIDNVFTLTTSQIWNVPEGTSKIRVELWGAAGGGGGAGAYSYSYNLNRGGDGGSGGYIRQELDVTPGQPFNVFIGDGGAAGHNAYNPFPPYWGDTNGGNGGDTWFGSYKASGGKGGKGGSYAPSTVNGNAGTNNLGAITGYADPPNVPILNVFSGLPRSYLSERVLTSRPGRGGEIIPYSSSVQPTPGEGGAAVITLLE